MSRRRAAAVIAAVLAIAAPGSSQPASAADEAANVNGESISVDDFEAALEDAGVVDAASATANAAVARSELVDLITDVARRQFLRAHGIEADAGTEADQLERLLAPDVPALAGVYADRPAMLGIICARYIVVVDEDAAEDAAAALEAGREFGDVAAEFTLDPTILDVDGWISGDPDNPCIPLTQLQFDARLADAFVNSAAGEAVAPVVIDDPRGAAVLVIQLAKFDEVTDAIEAFYDDAAGQGTSVGELLFSGWLLDADVTVNPRYGRWDAASASIVPLGQE